LAGQAALIFWVRRGDAYLGKVRAIRQAEALVFALYTERGANPFNAPIAQHFFGSVQAK